MSPRIAEADPRSRPGSAPEVTHREGGGRDKFTLQEAFELARACVQTLLVINGGAAVAMLAFYGQALNARFMLSDEGRLWMGIALALFCLGVFLATVIFFLGFRAHLLWGTRGSDPEAYREAVRLHRIAFWCSMGCMLSFFAGCFAAYQVVTAPLAVETAPAMPPR